MAHLANCGSSEWGLWKQQTLRVLRSDFAGPVTATGTICHRDVGEQYPLSRSAVGHLSRRGSYFGFHDKALISFLQQCLEVPKYLIQVIQRRYEQVFTTSSLTTVVQRHTSNTEIW
jgi:hypothetical protein